MIILWTRERSDMSTWGSELLKLSRLFSDACDAFWPRTLAAFIKLAGVSVCVSLAWVSAGCTSSLIANMHLRKRKIMRGHVSAEVNYACCWIYWRSRHLQRSVLRREYSALYKKDTWTQHRSSEEDRNGNGKLTEFIQSNTSHTHTHTHTDWTVFGRLQGPESESRPSDYWMTAWPPGPQPPTCNRYKLINCW